MFVETITAPAEEWKEWTAQLGLLSDPPAALVAAIAWSTGDGSVTAVNLWESPEAVGDFFMERTQHVLQTMGQPKNKPARHGEPVAVYIRS
jgi:hypothetical protein